MSTLIWKELRENLKWAFLAMLALGAAEVFALCHIREGFADYHSYGDGVTLCKAPLLVVTTFGCATAGFLLGLIQVLPELKRDRWAALLHRPVSRGVIFAGKASAGVFLYAIATVPPFLTCVWLAATPGHFAAPFVPGLALAATADTCAGLLYYFAALALALHRGGRVALKALPLLAAIHVSYFVVESNTFAAAVWAVVLMAAALSMAAWGAMHNQLSLRARPWLGKLAFLSVAFYGLCGLGDMTRFVLDALVPKKTAFVRYFLSDMGEPIKLTYVNNNVISVEDLEGKIIQDPDYKPDRVREHLHYLNLCARNIGDSHGWKSPWGETQYRRTDTYIQPGTAFSYPRLEQWYFLVQQRHAIGVLPRERVFIGRLDARGFVPISEAPIPFPPETVFSAMGRDSYWFWDAHGVRFVYLGRKAIVDLSLPASGPVYGVATASSRSEDEVVQVAAVALSSVLAVFDPKTGRPIATFPYHREMDRWGCLEVGVNGAKGTFYLWYSPSFWLPEKVRETMPSYIEEVDREGRTLRSFTIPPLPRLAVPRSWDKILAQRLRSPGFFFGAMIAQKAGALRGGNRELTTETAVWITIVSSLLAGITFWQARRAHLSRREAWEWVCLSLALNLAGFILFRLAAERPSLAVCPACKRDRPVDRDNCPHCGRGWPPRQFTGTEIFDRAETREAVASA